MEENIVVSYAIRLYILVVVTTMLQESIAPIFSLRLKHVHLKW
jgi:hypothetical protein